jgi:hypothetical protein
VADVPDTLVLKRNRDLVGLRRHPWPRWLVLGLVALFGVLGLLNVFGQRPATARASSSAAELKLYAPTHLRGGLLFTARFHITARQELRKATLVLDPGWIEGMAVNTIEPSPIGEGSDNGRVTLELGHIPAGKSHILWMQFQVNATNIAWKRPAGVELLDGDKRLLRINRSYTIYP